MSLRDEILALDDLVSETIIVPQWRNKELLIRQLTAKRFIEITKATKIEKNEELFLATLIAESVFDPETGEKVFTPDDIPALMEKNLSALRLIGEKAISINGLDDSEEDLRKNS